MSAANAHVIDATTANFETEVLEKSLQVPVLLDFWAEWCGPCKTLGPVLEKLAGEYNGAFVLAKVDVDAEQEIGAAFQIRSIPTLYLLKGGQPVDGVPGALPEGQLREWLTRNGIEPAAAAPVEDAEPAPVDPHTQAIQLRKAIEAEPDKEELKLELAVALLRIGAAAEAEQLLDALPANLGTDDRAVGARARLAFAHLLKDAPPPEVLESVIANTPDDLQARHLLGVHRIVDGHEEAGLEHFLHMLRIDRDYQDGLPRRSLIDAFRIVDDAELVSRYRRKMASLLF